MNNKIVNIIDERTNTSLGMYDITNMEGNVKVYNRATDDYGSYEQDMLDRGAVKVFYMSYAV